MADADVRAETHGPLVEPPRPASDAELEALTIAVIRGLAMDAPEAAHSGHPGTAMALAPLAYVLFTEVLRHDPSDPGWFDRDRFVLSCGHASILLYAMLYLTGYGLELDDLRSFRQWGSRTPGHPERGITPGVEVTTGPLGQGFANAVGMALAERILRARLGPEIVDHHVFVVCSDGDLMEGLSHEAASLAGHLRLGRLVALYDDNRITIDGPTTLALSDDVQGRFEAYGWRVLPLGEVADDTEALRAAFAEARASDERPTLLVLRSHIGWPAPTKRDTSEAHGDPLGPEEVRRTKELLGLPPEEPFFVPPEVVQHCRAKAARHRTARHAWQARLAAHPEAAKLLEAMLAGGDTTGWQDRLPRFEAGGTVATRAALRQCLDGLSDALPGLVAGAADLTGNTGVARSGAVAQSAAHPEGTQIHYGVREHAMAAVMNGMALHGGLLPIGGTFLVFSDYLRPALRLAALQSLPVVFAFSHDSIGLGEDGPTHQPVEHLAALRAMPGLAVVRPADANECAAAVRVALERRGPTALCLTRQGVPVLEGTVGAPVERGAYVLVDAEHTPPDVVLAGSGSEVQLCVQAASRLKPGGIDARVVSMPSFELFEEQDAEYQSAVLPPSVPVLGVEAASSFGWERYADDVVALDRFGASAPGPVVLAELGFTADHVAARARRLVAAWGSAARSPRPRGRAAAAAWLEHEARQGGGP